MVVDLFSEGPIRLLQSLSSPVLDAFFLAVTHSGSVLFFLVAVVLVYWLWDKRLALFLSVLLLGSWAVNGYLKALFGMPRPPEALHKTAAGGHGLPSGHAQSGAAFWGALAERLRGPWVAVAAAMIPLVALSRVYLGVHYVGDVLVGAALGLATVAGAVLLADAGFWARLGTRPRLLLAAGGPAALGVPLHLVGYPILVVWGLLTGVTVGYVLEGEWVGLARPTGAPAVALRVLVGPPAALGAFLGAQEVSGALPVFLAHVGTGLLVTLILPWVFGLAEAFFLRRGPSVGDGL